MQKGTCPSGTEGAAIKSAESPKKPDAFYAKKRFFVELLQNMRERCLIQIKFKGANTSEEVTEREIRPCKRIKNSETKGMDNSETEEA